MQCCVMKLSSKSTPPLGAGVSRLHMLHSIEPSITKAVRQFEHITWLQFRNLEACLNSLQLTHDKVSLRRGEVSVFKDFVPLSI